MCASAATNPPADTGNTSTTAPLARAVSSTAACSIDDTATRPNRPACRSPIIARLIASVAPDVKITRPPGGNSAATCARATSTAAAAARPGRCALCGLAKPIASGPQSHGNIAARASGAKGVVA